MRRRLFFLLMLVVLVLPALAGFAPARQAQIDLAASAGYDGYFRQGQWIPVRVVLANRGPTLDGEIRVRTGGNAGLAETTYRTPITLSQGVRKQVFLYVSVETYAQRVQVELVDGAGDVVARVEASLRLASASDVLYAVVTESPLGAVDLTGASPGKGESHQVNWQIDEIPPLADALAGLDVLLLHDVDAGALSVEQTAALAGWVRQGGHLIVAGGEFWRRVTAGLEDLLPVTLQGTRPAGSLAPLADYARADAASLDAEMTIALTQAKPNTRTLISLDDTPLIVRGRYGGGTVDFLAVDPQTEPLRSWDDIDRLWYALVASTGQTPSWLNGISSWSMAREATLTTSSAILPTFVQLCGFLALYIALVGPLNYLVLKRLNRREWAWFTIPALIAFFSVLAYTVGFNLRGSVPTVNRLAAVLTWPTGERARVDAVVGVQSPRRITYNIAVEDGTTLRALPDLSTGLGVPVTITEGQQYVAEDIPIDAGMVASFVTGGEMPAQAIDGQATWRLSGTQSPRVVGSVTNTLDQTLEEAVILIKGESRYLGDLAPGESRTFDITIGPQDPGPLSLGSTPSYANTVYSSPWRYSSGPGWCFAPEGLALTINDVMRNETFPCGATNVTERQQELRRRFRLLGALVVDWDVSGGRGSGVYLFGWTRSAPLEIDLLGRAQNVEDTTLIIAELPVTVETADVQVQIPPALTTWTAVRTDDPGGTLDVSPTNFRLNAGEQAIFEFMPLPDMRLAQVDALELGFAAQGLVALEIWDWREEEWVPVSVDPVAGESLLVDPGALVGPENAVRVRVALQDAAVFNEVDYVKVTYRGSLAAARPPASQG